MFDAETANGVLIHNLTLFTCLLLAVSRDERRTGTLDSPIPVVPFEGIRETWPVLPP